MREALWEDMRRSVSRGSKTSLLPEYQRGHFKSTREGLQDGSAYKSAHLKASGPESNLWVPHGERRDLIPKSCPLTSCVPLHLHVHKLMPLKD